MPTPYIFQKLAKKAADAGIKRADYSAARKWFWDQARKVRNVDVNRMMRETPSRMFARLDGTSVGSMVQFWYDAKHKDTLPYWDLFPLIFVVADEGKHFTGINLHYLPPLLRAKLMQGLYDLAVRNKDNKIVRLQLSYGLLKSAAKLAPFKPCFKRYLKTHTKSRFMYVPPADWDKALLLPTARFVGAKDTKVWADSRKKF